MAQSRRVIINVAQLIEIKVARNTVLAFLLGSCFPSYRSVFRVVSLVKQRQQPPPPKPCVSGGEGVLAFVCTFLYCATSALRFLIGSVTSTLN